MVGAIVGVFVAAVAIGVIAYTLGRKDTQTPTASAPTTTTTTTKVLSSTSEVRATTTTAPPSTTTSTSSTSTPSSNATGVATPLEAARSAAVVFYTYGVAAKGYPSFDTIIAPSARPSVLSMVIDADYRNAGCTQVVESIKDLYSNPPTYGFELRLLYQCPDGAPTSSADGSSLPLSVDLYVVEVTVAPSPAGTYWATQIQIAQGD